MPPVIVKHFGYPVQAASLAFLNATLQVAQTFGAKLTAEQDASITAAFNAAWVLLMMLISYSKNGKVLSTGEDNVVP